MIHWYIYMRFYWYSNNLIMTSDIWYQSDTNLIPIWFQSDTNLIQIWYKSDITSRDVETLSRLPDILTYFHHSCPAPHILCIQFNSIYQTFTRFIGQCPVWLAVSTPLITSTFWYLILPWVSKNPNICIDIISTLTTSVTSLKTNWY